MVVDRYHLLWYLFAGAALSILMSMRYLEIEHENHGEFYSLLLFSVVGMMCMAAGFDVVLIFIGLELMAISTYVLVGFLRTDRRSNEAALKYLLLGAFSSGIFAYGLSLFYGLTGSTSLLGIRSGLVRMAASHPNHADPIAVIALLTVAVGLFFKIAAIPFHQWLPDAYEGAPTSVTGFMSVAVKPRRHAAAHLPLGPVSPADRVRAAADLRFDPDHDGSELAADPEQPEAPAGVLVHRPCRLHAARPGRAGFGHLPRARFL
jgi:NADH-quinone oxidoreductase subunit N